MGISGSDVAYRLGIAGASARADSTRSGYFQRDVVPVALNGTVRSGVRQASIRIDLNTGSEPHRASFEMTGGSGYVPLAGHAVTIGHGTSANPLFSGRVRAATRINARPDERRPVYNIDCVGHLLELGQTRVATGYSARSLTPRAIVTAVLAVTTPSATAMGFTAEGVDDALLTVGEFNITPTDSIPEAFGRLFRAADATWHIDHNRQIRAFSGVDTAPPAPATLTVPSSTFWGLRYTPTDLSRLFTRAQVLGAGQAIVADYQPARHGTMPVVSASLIANQNGSTGDDVFVNTSESWMVDGVEVPGNFFYRPEAQFNAGKASVFMPLSFGGTSLVVASANVASVSPLDEGRWYDIAGQWLYTASTVGVFSATGSSIAYVYGLYASGSGAALADINPGADIASTWNLSVAPAARSLMRPIVPAGTDVTVYATRVNTPARDAVSSLMGSTAFGLVAKTFTDGRLGVDGAVDVALAALERGAPDQWQTVEFNTRDRNADIGRPVYVSISSFAETGATTISGAFTAHDVQLGGFDQLTATRGPIRTVIAGTVRRPTLWQVLQGDN